jgi:hypothetical protein
MEYTLDEKVVVFSVKQHEVSDDICLEELLDTFPLQFNMKASLYKLKMIRNILYFIFS